MARQLCAGLAAAHDRGVLHRDLKPANVMIDGRGHVKITDFGLAGVDDSIEGAEARVGTPAYMSPEQWAGTEVTTRSDLYALGLILYEIFTGERPHKGKTSCGDSAAPRGIVSADAFERHREHRPGCRAGDPQLPGARPESPSGVRAGGGGGVAGR